jgi:hypothetical protein
VLQRSYAIARHFFTDAMRTEAVHSYEKWKSLQECLPKAPRFSGFASTRIWNPVAIRPQLLAFDVM